jgi:hypothetical protein
MVALAFGVAWLRGVASSGAAALLCVWPADRSLGSLRNNGPELLEGIAA